MEKYRQRLYILYPNYTDKQREYILKLRIDFWK